MTIVNYYAYNKVIMRGDYYFYIVILSFLMDRKIR